MKCSLIIPAYNAEKTISICLESALKQSAPSKSYEIIVVDDGSTDRTPEIVKKFPVKLIKQKNQGPAVAINNGAKEASGEIVIFTDSDCELHAEFIKNILSPFEDDPEIVGVQGSYKTRQKEFMAKFVQVEIETRYMRMTRNPIIDFIGTYAAAYKRDIFIRNGCFDTGFPLASGEDTEFSYKLHEQGYKLVFRPIAFVFHLHPTKLIEYLKIKFFRGYWRIRLYKMHPEKIVKDSYTPQTLKFQVITIPLIPVLMLMPLIDTIWFFGFAALCAFYLYWSLPLIQIFKKNNYRWSGLIPFILLLRASSIAMGLFWGYINDLKPSNIKGG